MYVATINIPGCLPEAEPITFDSLEEAWLCIVYELEYDRDIEAGLEEYSEPSEFDDAIQEAKRASIDKLLGTVIVNGLSYSVDILTDSEN